MSQPTLRTSPGLHAVLIRPPAWPERWGTLLVASLLGTLLAGAGLVRYPDVVTVAFTGRAGQATPGEVAVWASLPAAVVPTLHPGQPVQLALAGSSPGWASAMTGRVVALAPSAAAGRYQLIIRLYKVPPLPALAKQRGTLHFTTPAASLLSRMWKPSAPASSSPH
jgi:hypothetical protein